jgi:hypothetical protein
MSDPGVRRASAAEYAWVGDWLDEVSGAYCLTLARGLTPQQFLARIGARVDPAPRRGLDSLAEASAEIWARHEGERLLIGVTTVPGGWALAMELNGHLGVTPGVIVPLSAGTVVVSHYRNDAVHRFYFVEDQVIRLYFEPLFPADREGSERDELAGAMTQAGFDLRKDAGAQGDVPAAAASFALAEILTGVRVSPELIEDSSYWCGVVQAPEL